MTENELLFQISNLVNGHLSFPQAVAFLLQREANTKSLNIEHPDRPSDAVKLLDSFDQPYRSLYSVDLRDGGEVLGKVTLCFASDTFQGALPQRLADFVGEQLGMLLARTRLADRRTQLKAEIAGIEQDLATRKVMQRAEGILIAKREMPATVARLWIAQQSRKTGLSQHDVADRIVAYHQATGLYVWSGPVPNVPSLTVGVRL
jgi:GAF domain-containing protein